MHPRGPLPGCRRSPGGVGCGRAVGEVGDPVRGPGCALVRAASVPSERTDEGVERSARDRHVLPLTEIGTRYRSPSGCRFRTGGPERVTTLSVRVLAASRTPRCAPRARLPAALRRHDDHHRRRPDRRYRARIRCARIRAAPRLGIVFAVRQGVQALVVVGGGVLSDRLPRNLVLVGASLVQGRCPGDQPPRCC